MRAKVKGEEAHMDQRVNKKRTEHERKTERDIDRE